MEEICTCETPVSTKKKFMNRWQRKIADTLRVTVYALTQSVLNLVLFHQWMTSPALVHLHMRGLRVRPTQYCANPVLRARQPGNAKMNGASCRKNCGERAKCVSLSVRAPFARSISQNWVEFGARIFHSLISARKDNGVLSRRRHCRSDRSTGYQGICYSNLKVHPPVWYILVRF